MDEKQPMQATGKPIDRYDPLKSSGLPPMKSTKGGSHGLPGR
ncbi:MAG TPA: hypothetical protein VE914_17635 [Candidatus Angelobacter sp.]|nr:hypothetical protein [Candidatus Angelobacter sp.]